MYTEIGFLVIIILGVSLFRNVYQSEEMVVDTIDDPNEGFQNEEKYLRQIGKVDIRNERQKLLDELTRIDVATHEYSLTKDRASVRVGLERMIAEIDRALESEGRYLDTKTLEAIMRSGRTSLA
jgi:transcriptional regulator of NAD metabolism